MTVQNEEDMIEETISCIRDQTIKPSSIHVLDDGSTDSTGMLLDRMDDVTVTHLPPHPPQLSSDKIMENRDQLMCDASTNMDYALNADADLHIPSNYMESITHRMKHDGVMVACGVDKDEPLVIPPEPGLVIDARWLHSHDMLPKFPAGLLVIQASIDGHPSAMYKDIPRHIKRKTGTNYDSTVWRLRGEKMRRYGVVFPLVLWRSISIRSPDYIRGYLSYKQDKLPPSFQKWFKDYHTQRLKTKLGLRSWMFQETNTTLFVHPKKNTPSN